MGLFYEVAKGVLKRPREVSKRALEKRFAKMNPWDDFIVQPEVFEKPPARHKAEREELRREVLYEKAETLRKKLGDVYKEPHREPFDYRSERVGLSHQRVYEQPPVVKRKIDITDEQYQRYLMRAADKTPTPQQMEMTLPGGGGEKSYPIGAGSQAAEELVGTYQPPREQMFTRLFDKTQPYETRPGVVKYKHIEMPYEEAKEVYMKDRPEFGGEGKYLPLSQYIPPADVLHVPESGVPEYIRKTYRPLKQDVEKLQESIKAVTTTTSGYQRKAKVKDVDTTELIKKASVLDAMWPVSYTHLTLPTIYSV